ncbi:DUF1613-domain-containing protein [Mollisia scopiformis]|uniref:tRNA (uracil-O(2)-)-methyltransferase n=1 Tax=Mollisia scopiformis TaxID=149040 RepID=A0A194XSS4_MOLSC|nr:DUF1613-domain-containing protein [Mollisia scopiformis]KUJ23248.1 DUF1613-domain-containing protein [Mollisia scopiformis]
MVFTPESIPSGAVASLKDDSGKLWTPLYNHKCSFPPEIFRQVMLNLIRNPNINSNHLFRADISFDQPYCEPFSNSSDLPARITHVTGFDLKTVMEGSISIHYSFFESEPRSVKLERTAQHLLAVLYKHGQGLASGYVKRVQHDLILPQATVQNTYARLKAKYARKLVTGWVETTDPAKHVFEDLGIAAFLIELWAEMFKDQDFPGFVDIGCGNGLLVHILLEEGYVGWGFDARRRKSWATFSQNVQDNLKEMVLIPSIISTQPLMDETRDCRNDTSQITASAEMQNVGIQDGQFPKNTFIISNHADELTPWTPILATLSECSFMMIPCCSHALSGIRFRAPSPKTSGPPTSAYASLVAWVTKLATDCGWNVEKEMLRIPSTRNTALIGRHRSAPFDSTDLPALVNENGGAAGWEENALKLVKGAARGH